MNERIEIQLSKRKLVLLFVGSVVFVILGWLGTMNPEEWVSPMFRSPQVIRISGIVGICFGMVTVFLSRKLFDRRPGLVIDAIGITDNTNATSVGLIEWNDITRVERKQVMSTKFLILHTSDPEKYLQRVKNLISKRAAEMNERIYGSPISIASNSLKMNFEDLEALIIQEFRKKKSKSA